MAAACERQDPASACLKDGELTADVFGAIEAELAWRGDALECEGMPRPFGEGARLRFAGGADVDGETLPLAFIIALPDLEKGRAGDELPAGVTLIDERDGRFFATPEQTTCWADIAGQWPLGDVNDGDEPDYRVTGLLYCVSPLAEVNGTDSVTLSDLHFVGRLNWRQPQ